MKGPNEKDIQNAILGYLSLRKILAWPIQNQGTYDAIKGIYRRPGRFYVRGVPDIECALQHGVTLRIEVKTKTGRISEEQNELHAKLVALGHLVMVARSVTDVDRFMQMNGLIA